MKTREFTIQVVETHKSIPHKYSIEKYILSMYTRHSHFQNSFALPGMADWRQQCWSVDDPFGDFMSFLREGKK